MDLVEINHEEYGLEENKAKEISSVFKPMLDKMVELENEYNKIIKLKINEETVSKAKALRLKYVKVRTGTADIHKKTKSYYLLVGKFIDGWKNTQLLSSQGKEETLMNIEKHYENLEKQKQAKIQDERAKTLHDLEVEFIPENLHQMPEDVWLNYLVGVKESYKAKKEAEIKAEEERKAREQAEAEERKRIEEENKRLKAEAEQREKEEKIRLEKEEKERAKREAEEKKRLEAEAKEREERERKELERQEKERKEKVANELRLKKEREAREKAQFELEEKNRKEEKEKAEAKAKHEAELKKGDSDKIDDLIKDLELLKIKYNFQANDYKDLYEKTGGLLEKIIIYIKQNS